MTRPVYRCPLCGGTDVYRKLWVGMNDPAAAVQTPDDEERWCADCGSTIPFVNEVEEG